LTSKLLILDAGSPMSNNLVRSLRAGDPSFTIIGCSESRFFLKKSIADRNYLLPLSPGVSAFRKIINAEHIDIIIPSSDADVYLLSECRDELGCRTFLPSKSAIERCNDKYALTVFLRRRGIPAPLTYPILSVADVAKVFRRFKPGSRLWCRIRGGSGSYAALPVKTPGQVHAWISYWQRMRAVPRGSFTLSEYLSGRDYCVQCLWDKGTLVLAKMAERITYLDTGSPSGVSSMPALAKTAFEPSVINLSKKAIRSLDANASGVFFIDFKERDDGTPCITEINAGRFATMTNLHDLTGKYNMAVTYVKLGLGGRIRIRRGVDFAEGYYLVRSVDTLPDLVYKDDLFEGIEELQ